MLLCCDDGGGVLCCGGVEDGTTPLYLGGSNSTTSIEFPSDIFECCFRFRFHLLRLLVAVRVTVPPCGDSPTSIKLSSVVDSCLVNDLLSWHNDDLLLSPLSNFFGIRSSFFLHQRQKSVQADIPNKRERKGQKTAWKTLNSGQTLWSTTPDSGNQGSYKQFIYRPEPSIRF